MKQILICLWLALSVLGLEIKADAAPGITSNVDAVSEANTGFALDLYGQLHTTEGNLFFSPFSISTVLAMTYGGARGETQKQMADTLHFDLPSNSLPNNFATLLADIEQDQSNGAIQLATADSLWPQKGATFLPDFLKLCEQDYGATITPVDFVGNPEAARETINNWVSSRTQGKITDLIRPNLLVASNQFVLVNAIYLKAKWDSDHKFNSNLTSVATFHVSSEKTVLAPLMEQTTDFAIKDLPDLQVLEMPYSGGGLSMIVLLPRQVEGLKDLETRLTPANIKIWTQNLESKKVHVTFPKFKETSNFSLGDTLKAMGMAGAFDPEKADFSGMNGEMDFYIGAVLHKAFVDVNEEGTEAAAATAVVMEEASAPDMGPPPEEFIADHPFIFFIRENRTGSILFLGRIMDPTQ